jgi:hypothetical protein
MLNVTENICEQPKEARRPKPEVTPRVSRVTRPNYVRLNHSEEEAINNDR